MLKRFPEFLPKLVPGMMVTEDPAAAPKGLVDLSLSYSHANYKAHLSSRKSVLHFDRRRIDAERRTDESAGVAALLKML